MDLSTIHNLKTALQILSPSSVLSVKINMEFLHILSEHRDKMLSTKEDEIEKNSILCWVVLGTTPLSG